MTAASFGARCTESIAANGDVASPKSPTRRLLATTHTEVRFDINLYSHPPHLSEASEKLIKQMENCRTDEDVHQA